MAKFMCGLCKKEVKRGTKFSVDITEWITDSSGQGFESEDEVCHSCAKKIEKKIQSMRK
ncbi:hypothetical protein NVP1017O_45 [Vibrio phage 1.017.O._10N.286.55.C11]|nr:hypothetical protein NVP1017O_45 [Vibrio phage 1.017.O._10N.286.55.C11]AUR85477.1 hypothetical protein NVP1075O_45 [Vibrio phage 1.075.O._10N.286.55.B10]AUR87023.1 hypothetical protein NVP1093O_45 [Vibrio phage 1.093.O._10N.286.55.E10]AUR87096.1 hypothetical protein NVP1094O_45 [Vibrio phage 1.094.O._10N.286.55.E12]AUR91772.1 hypothetical protein NVP1164O_36 [Vibrio phage 1.164.O._10N.261.51.A7]